MIKVNSPATSRRTFKVPGRGPAPLGRPLKDRSGRVQIFVSEEDDLVASLTNQRKNMIMPKV